MPACARSAPVDRHHVGEHAGEYAQRGGLVRHAARRQDDEPGAGGPGGGDGLGGRMPGDAVAPGVLGLAAAAVTVPAGQLGQDGQQGGGGAERLGEHIVVLLFDGVPEASVAVGRGVRRGVRGGAGEPVGLPLEGVGGRGRTGGVRERGPVHRGAVGVGLSHRVQQGGHLVLGAPCAGQDRTVRQHRGQYGVGTDLDQHIRRTQPGDRIGEPHRMPRMIDPVLHRREGVPALRRRTHRHPRRLRTHNSPSTVRNSASIGSMSGEWKA
ncbi:hypothetical protein SANTM175S_04310 [Streptomyces antimycoticus]